MPIYFEATDSTWDLLKGEEKGQNVYSGSMLYVASEENFPLVVHNNILLSAVAGGRLHKHHQALHDRAQLIFEYQNSAFAWINLKSTSNKKSSTILMKGLYLSIIFAAHY